MRCSCLAFALTPVILGIMTRCDLNQRAPRVNASVSEKVCKPTAACCSFATLSLVWMHAGGNQQGCQFLARQRLDHQACGHWYQEDCRCDQLALWCRCLNSECVSDSLELSPAGVAVAEKWGVPTLSEPVVAAAKRASSGSSDVDVETHDAAGSVKMETSVD
jgi:hypothetical protein